MSDKRLVASLHPRMTGQLCLCFIIYLCAQKVVMHSSGSMWSCAFFLCLKLHIFWVFPLILGQLYILFLYIYQFIKFTLLLYWYHFKGSYFLVLNHETHYNFFKAHRVISICNFIFQLSWPRKEREDICYSKWLEDV